MSIFDTKTPSAPAEVKVYKVTSKTGDSAFISARVESEAFQKAVSFCGDSLIDSYEEVK